MKNKRISKKVLFSFCQLISYLLLGIVCYGQTDGDYRSVTTGNWSDAGTWETYYRNSWIAATNPPSSLNGVITIRNGHTVTVDKNVSVDQVISESESILIVGLSNSAQSILLTIVDGLGTDLIVNGIIENLGSILNINGTTIIGTIQFNANSNYIHNRNGGIIPSAIWDTKSTCKIKGYTNSEIGGLGQDFGNFIWDCSLSGSVYYNMPISGISIKGDFTVNRTGAGTDFLNNYLEINQKYLQVSGSLNINGGTLKIGNTGSEIVDVNGSVTIEGGTLYLSSGQQNGILNVKGDFSFIKGLITTNGKSGGFINFNGNKPQKYTALISISDEINFTVDRDAILQMADESTYLRGKGYFKLSEGATLGVTSKYGINKLSPTDKSKYGNILVTKARTYNPGANYIYNSSIEQETGNGLSIANNLTIDNTKGVSLSNNTIVNGTLTHVEGDINTGSNVLTINGTHIAGTHIISGVGTYILATDATLKTAHLNGVSGTISTEKKDLSNNANFEFNSTSEQATGAAMPTLIKNLIINNPSSVHLSQDVSVSSKLNLIKGQLKTGSRNLITLTHGSKVEGAKVESFVNGPIKKVGNDEFTFPVGKDNLYSPISISSPQNVIDAYTAEYFPFLDPTWNKITSPGLLEVSSCEYWDLQRLSGNSNVDVTLYWQEDNKCSSSGFISDLRAITIAHFNGSSWNTHGGFGIGTISNGSITWKDVSEFSPFTFGKISVDDPLPVHFEKIRAIEKPNGVQIDFTNLTELDISYYAIERSDDGKAFSVVTKLAPLKNNNASSSYSFLDASAMKGKYIYRIKAVENTGKAIFSTLVGIDFGSKLPGMNVCAKGGQIFLQGTGFPAGKYTFGIYSISGQRIATDPFFHGGGSFSQTTYFNIVKTGVYILKINGPVQMQKKFVVQ